MAPSNIILMAANVGHAAHSTTRASQWQSHASEPHVRLGRLALPTSLWPLSMRTPAQLHQNLPAHSLRCDSSRTQDLESVRPKSGSLCPLWKDENSQHDSRIPTLSGSLVYSAPKAGIEHLRAGPVPSNRLSTWPLMHLYLTPGLGHRLLPLRLQQIPPNWCLCFLLSLHSNMLL